MAWLVTDASKRFVAAPRSAGRQVLIENEVTQGPGGEHARYHRVNHRQRRTIELGDRCCQGLLFVPDLLCTAAD
jgi:hypothetical protein